MGMKVGGQLTRLVLIGSRSVHPQEFINRGAKDRKIKKRKLNEYLRKHGRTAKQVKKRKEKMITIADFILEFFVFSLSILFFGMGLFFLYLVVITIWDRYAR